MSDEAERGQTYVPLPDRGPGSPAGWSRRIGALVIDWICGNAAAFLVGGGAVWQPGSGWLIWLPLLCWLILVWAATGLLGASPGQLLLGLRVIRVDRQPVGVVRAAPRTALIALVIPPLAFTSQGRGLHDLAAGTIVVNGPKVPDDR
ncbi:MAG TPA: RDD family protein [Jiangellaceae bacterium]|nr:RDD family protein [Jiangellaceae bacterium]